MSEIKNEINTVKVHVVDTNLTRVETIQLSPLDIVCAHSLDEVNRFDMKIQRGQEIQCFEEELAKHKVSWTCDNLVLYASSHKSRQGLSKLKWSDNVIVSPPPKLVQIYRDEHKDTNELLLSARNDFLSTLESLSKDETILLIIAKGLAIENEPQNPKAIQNIKKATSTSSSSASKKILNNAKVTILFDTRIFEHALYGNANCKKTSKVEKHVDIVPDTNICIDKDYVFDLAETESALRTDLSSFDRERDQIFQIDEATGLIRFPGSKTTSPKNWYAAIPRPIDDFYNLQIYDNGDEVIADMVTSSNPVHVVKEYPKPATVHVIYLVQMGSQSDVKSGSAKVTTPIMRQQCLVEAAKLEVLKKLGIDWIAGGASPHSLLKKQVHQHFSSNADVRKNQFGQMIKYAMDIANEQDIDSNQAIFDTVDSLSKFLISQIRNMTVVQQLACCKTPALQEQDTAMEISTQETTSSSSESVKQLQETIRVQQETLRNQQQQIATLLSLLSPPAHAPSSASNTGRYVSPYHQINQFGGATGDKSDDDDYEFHETRKRQRKGSETQDF